MSGRRARKKRVPSPDPRTIKCAYIPAFDEPLVELVKQGCWERFREVLISCGLVRRTQDRLCARNITGKPCAHRLANAVAESCGAIASGSGISHERFVLRSGLMAVWHVGVGHLIDVHDPDAAPRHSVDLVGVVTMLNGRLGSAASVTLLDPSVDWCAPERAWTLIASNAHAAKIIRKAYREELIEAPPPRRQLHGATTQSGWMTAYHDDTTTSTKTQTTTDKP